jgi:hypothetical protein
MLIAIESSDVKISSIKNKSFKFHTVKQVTACKYVNVYNAKCPKPYI